MTLRLYNPDETGRDGYPLEWHRTIKHEVREQAGHRCVRCGHPYRVGESRAAWSPCDERCTHRGPLRTVDRTERAYNVTIEIAEARDLVRMISPAARVEAAWRILTVHHLDGNKLNCRWWNLAALCQRCHLQIQGKVKMHQVYPWPHSEWFRPFAAGYYALTYLGEETTREEAIARLDELLALECVS